MADWKIKECEDGKIEATSSGKIKGCDCVLSEDCCFYDANYFVGDWADMPEIVLCQSQTLHGPNFNTDDYETITTWVNSSGTIKITGNYWGYYWSWYETFTLTFSGSHPLAGAVYTSGCLFSNGWTQHPDFASLSFPEHMSTEDVFPDSLLLTVTAKVYEYPWDQPFDIPVTTLTINRTSLCKYTGIYEGQPVKLEFDNSATDWRLYIYSLGDNGSFCPQGNCSGNRTPSPMTEFYSSTPIYYAYKAVTTAL